MIAEHTKVHNFLLSLVQQRNEGDLLPSQSELCKQFDVSVITVRRALDDVERKGLIFRKKGKGTFVRKNKMPVRRCRIFLILSVYVTLHDEFIKGMVEQVRKSSTGLYIHHYSDGDLLSLENTINEFNPDGILWVAPEGKNWPAVAENLRSSGRNVMIFNRIAKNSHLSYVSGNNAGGIRELTELFIGHGRKRIAFFGCNPETNYSRLRHEAFTAAVESAGPGIETLTVPLANSYQRGSMFAPALEMLKSFKPDAILCSQGELLFDLLPAIRECGLKIPGDVEVGTYNLVPEIFPEREFIHEIDQKFCYMAAEAVRELETIIKGEKNRSTIVIQPEVLIKDFGRKRNPVRSGIGEANQPQKGKI